MGDCLHARKSSEYSNQQPAPWDGKILCTVANDCSTTVAASSGRSVAEADWLGPKISAHPALVPHSSDELRELWQWLCHGNSTVDIAVAITIIIQTILNSQWNGVTSAPAQRVHLCCVVKCALEQ